MKIKVCILLAIIFFNCSSDSEESNIVNDPNASTVTFNFSSILDIDFNNLFNYSNPYIPAYIIKNNTNGNTINDRVATLGRVLFYDTNLSVDNTIACASCHKQALAFGDDEIASIGIDGLTTRHSMRLVNAKFSNESKFFWDERAATLEEQTTMPIRDEVEMGFSGENGNPNFEALITRLENTTYYPDLFEFAFGNSEITEAKMQTSLAQFIRSIQSFDSKYDEGRVNAQNDGQPFANFSDTENQGKNLFLAPPNFNNQGERIAGGLGCGGCHQAPEFSIDPNSLNNGIIETINNSGTDVSVTRSPALRDIVNTTGVANGGFMHDASTTNLETVLNHYNEINATGNNNLDPRLTPGGNPQRLNLTDTEKAAVIAFLKTLSGNDIYINEKWSDPFVN